MKVLERITLVITLVILVCFAVIQLHVRECTAVCVKYENESEL